MSKQTEALKLALEALENHPGNYKLSKAECAEYRAVEDALRNATTPLAQRKPLTDDEIWGAYVKSPGHVGDSSLSHLYAFARAIEAAHGITKGNT